MKTSVVALAGALCIHAAPAAAQLAPLQAQPSAIAMAPTSAAMLRVGTEVPLKLSEDLTTQNKQVKNGQRFRMEVAEDVRVNGVVVIPVGSPAVGEVTDVRNKGMWGKSGHIGARVLYATVNGRQVRLTGSFDDKGKAGGVGAVAVSAIVFAPAGFFMTGTSARMQTGFPVKGFVDEDVPLTMTAAAPMPLSVPIAVAAPVAAVPPAPSAGTSLPKATPAVVAAGKGK